MSYCFSRYSNPRFLLTSQVQEIQHPSYGKKRVTRIEIALDSPTLRQNIDYTKLAYQG